jgi:uncharacterized protein
VWRGDSTGGPSARSIEPPPRPGLLTLPTDLFERAADLEPALLRTLDAVHLAAAMALGDDLEGVVTYDERFAGAAEAQGIPVVTPGA